MKRIPNPCVLYDMVYNGMTTKLLGLALATIFLLSLDGFVPTLSAQRLDTVWQIQYERRIDTRTQKYVLDTLSIWFDESSARQKIGDDVDLVLQGDSLMMLNSFHRMYTSGPIEMKDMSWLSNPTIVWRRRRTPRVEVIDSSGTQAIASYTTRPMIFHYHNNAPIPIPMRLLVWAGGDVPISPEELKRFYELQTIALTDLAIDHETIHDTLLARGVLPFRTISDGRGRKQNDTSGVLTTELLSVRRTTVSADFFDPPASYGVNSMPVPSEEQLWELREVPMPGGPKE